MEAIKDYASSKYSHDQAQLHSYRAGQTATVTSTGPHRQVLAHTMIAVSTSDDEYWKFLQSNLIVRCLISYIFTVGKKSSPN